MELQVFDNQEFGKIRAFSEDGESWLVANDVSEILGYRAANDMTRNLFDDEKGTHIVRTPGGDQRMAVISESGFYHAVMQRRSSWVKNDEARRTVESFQRWVTHDVLPAIRKHGMYATPATVEAMLADPDTMIKTLQALKDERAARIEAERSRDLLLHAAKTYTTTELAKEMGMRSAQQLNRELEKRRIQYKQNGTWLLYSDYSHKGYTSVKQTVLDNGRVIYDRRWTGKGRDFLLNLLNDRDIMAVAID